MGFDDYAKEMRGTDRNTWLGQLCWYSVPESARVETEDLRQALVSVGLEGFMPKAPADHDIFRRVCTAQERKKVATDEPGVYENYLVRNVSRKLKRIVRQIVVERRNENNEQLGYEPKVHIEYDGAGRVKFHTLADDPGQALEVAEAIEADFYAERNVFNSYILRELIRKVLEQSRATSVRRGVYFVMAENAGRMNSLEVLQGTLPIEIHSLPLLDSKKQREMLKKAFEAETVGEIDKIMAEMDAMAEITPDRYATVLTQMKELKAKTKQYSGLLEDALGEADFRLNIFEAKVRKLMDKVKV